MEAGDILLLSLLCTLIVTKKVYGGRVCSKFAHWVVIAAEVVTHLETLTFK